MNDFALGLLLLVVLCVLAIAAVTLLFNTAANLKLTPLQRDLRVAAAYLLIIALLPLGSYTFLLLGAR